MAEGKKTDIDVAWHRVSVIERFSSVLYPINVPQLLWQLPTIGYIVPDLVLRGTPEQGKPIATKGNTELTLNMDNKTIGVIDKDPEKATTAFLELREFYIGRLDLSPPEVQYVEFDGQGWVRSKESPVRVFSHIWRDSKPIQKLGSILGEDATNYGIEIVPREQDPNNPKWFHVAIHPLPASSLKQYYVRWIWREPNSAQLLKRYAKVNDTLRTMISTIEAG